MREGVRYARCKCRLTSAGVEEGAVKVTAFMSSREFPLLQLLHDLPLNGHSKRSAVPSLIVVCPLDVRNML
jgi:hypothetical protein